ncbi:unnamed protein product [Amoebophrya sp. A120]|nr:unnamed protein product [Amoebophrya sp. A120]|eukprot:GSA120T00001653001.1
MEAVASKHPYDFPYPPYPLQVELMNTIVDACGYGRSIDVSEDPHDSTCRKQATLGLFESPTGTGKTMSLVCGLVSFLDQANRTPPHVAAPTSSKNSNSATEEGLQCGGTKNRSALFSGSFPAANETDDGQPLWVKQHAQKMLVEKWENTKNAFRRSHEARLQRLQRRHEEELRKDCSDAGAFVLGQGTYFRDQQQAARRTAKRHRKNPAADEEQEPDVAQFSLEYSSTYLLQKKLKANTAGGNTGSRTTHAAQDDEDADELTKNEYLNGAKKLQVIVCSRTHSQLSQFAEEIAKFVSHRNNEETDEPPLRVVSLASRIHGCCNPAIPKTNAAQCNEACQSLRDRKGCKYKAKSELVTDQILTQILSTQDIVSQAKELEACAYYGAREAVEEADFILVPYSCILHPKTREALSLRLENNIVVFDEAHNVFDACSDTHSCQVSFLALQKTRDYLAAYETKYTPVFGEDTKAGVASLKRVLDKLLSPSNVWAMEQAPPGRGAVASTSVVAPPTGNKKPPTASAATSKILTIAKFMLVSELESEDLSSLLHFIQARELCRKLRGFAEWHSRQTTNNTDHLRHQRLPAGGGPPGADTGGTNQQLSGIYNLVELLNALVFSAAEDRILIDAGPENKKIKILNLDVESHLFDFLREAKTVLFVAGTLEPRAEFALLRDRASRTFETAADHIVPVENTFARMLTHTPSTTMGVLDASSKQGSSCTNLPLDFRASRRLQQDMLRGLHATLQAIEGSLRRSGPKTCGMVVFFPSFDYMQKFAQGFYQSNMRQHAPSKNQAARTSAATGRAAALLGSTHQNKPAVVGSDESAHYVFVEKQGESADAMLKEFEAHTRKQLCLLFAVVGGRVSEGINFKDDMCRCVCVVGMPYPNPQDPVLQEKMKFLDARVRSHHELYNQTNSNSCQNSSAPADITSSSAATGSPNPPSHASAPLCGKDYYQMRCMKAVNQCIGRAIRHKNDWAALLLLDHRYNAPRVAGDISGWLRSRFRHTACNPDFLQQLDAFFVQHSRVRPPR